MSLSVHTYKGLELINYCLGFFFGIENHIFIEKNESIREYTKGSNPKGVKTKKRVLIKQNRPKG